MSNNEKIEDVIYSDEWNYFFEQLMTDPSTLCKKFCSGPINESINRAEE